MNTLLMSFASVVCCLSLGAVGAILGALMYDVAFDKQHESYRKRDDEATQRRFASMRARYARIKNE